MSEIASAYVSLMPSAKGFGSSMSRQIGPQMTSAGKTAGSRFGKVFAYASMSPLKAIGAAAVGLFAIQKVRAFFGASIDEAREAQKVSALTAAVIKSTGGAAQISAKQVADMAGRLSLLSGVDDEAIQGGENLLLTFKNIRNYVGGQFTGTFDQATAVALDMSTALGTEMKQSAILVGKALNDPVKGLTALSRVGVSFTEQQKKQIETLVKSGDTTKAQAIILRELNSEFGGAAAAAATAGDRFKTASANFEESVGTALLPQLDKLLNVGTDVISFLMTRVPPAFKAFKAAVMPVVNVIRDFVQAHLQPLFTILSGAGGAAIASFASLLGGTLVSVLLTLASALAAPVALIGALAGAAVYAYTHFASFKATVDQLVASIQGSLGPALQTAGGFFTATLLPGIMSIVSAVQANFLPVLQTMGNTFTTMILPAITSLVSYLAGSLAPIFGQIASIITGQVIPIIASLAQFFYGTLYPAVIQIVTAVASKLKPVFDQLVATFRSSVLPTAQKLLAKFHEWQPTLQKIITVLLKVIGKVLEFAAAILGKVLPVAIRFAGFLISHVVPAVAAVIGVIIQIIGKVIDFGVKIVAAVEKVAQFVKGLKDKFGDAVAFVKGIPGKIVKALGDLGSTLLHAGEDLIQGFIDGIGSKIGAVKDKLGSLTHSLTSWKGPPAKDKVLLHPAGRLIIQGLIDGFTSMFGRVKSTLGDLTSGIAARIHDASPKVLQAMQDMVAKTLDKTKSLADGIKAHLDSVKSDFASLADSIQQSFMPDLFSTTSAADFLNQGLAGIGTLQALKRAFRKLRGWGLDPKFISSLFSQGGADLIESFASGPKWQAQQAANVFGIDQKLSRQLGQSVASNQFGRMESLLQRQLDRADKQIAILNHLAKDIGHEINHVATDGHKRRKKAS